MAHLRSVEAQKQAKTRDRECEVIAPPEPVVLPPEECIPIDAAPEALPQHEETEAVGSKARVVIHGAAVAAAAAGGGLAQLPGVGALVITPIQVSMVIALGSLHGRTLDKSGALAVLAAAYGPYVGRTVSQLLIGLIPGVGNVTNAATAFVITESIGWSANNILSKD
jgi:uncharacterized protein (DUF697 family)